MTASAPVTLRVVLIFLWLWEFIGRLACSRLSVSGANVSETKKRGLTESLDVFLSPRPPSICFRSLRFAIAPLTESLQTG